MNDTIIPAVSSKWFVRQMSHFGVTPGDIFKGTGLDTTWLAKEDATISANDYIQLVINALDLTSDPSLGLKIGKWQNLLEYGIWGYAIMSCTTAEEAMSITFKYWELNGALVNVTAQAKEDILIWDIMPAFKFNDQRLLIYAVEELLSTTYVSCGVLFGKNLDILELHLSYPEPKHADLYHEFTTSPIYFGAAKNLLLAPADTLNLPTVTGHLGMKHVCEKHCQDLLLKLKKADKLVEKIRRLIVESMGRFPKTEDMARKLTISPRTLGRRLQERGTSYQKILNDVRAELARDYLKKTNLSIDQISELIGFTETTTFRRAFKKWTSISPSEYRKRAVLLKTS